MFLEENRSKAWHEVRFDAVSAKIYKKWLEALDFVGDTLMNF